jgi:hypothetical protein
MFALALLRSGDIKIWYQKEAIETVFTFRSMHNHPWLH